MKKKKLKKKIKKLEKRVKRYCSDLSGEVLEVDTYLMDKIKDFNDKITKLENDNKYYKEWMDRSGVDYKSWFEGENNGN